MSMFRRRKGIGYIPGPRPRLPDDEPSMLSALVWILVIVGVVAVAVIFGKHS